MDNGDFLVFIVVLFFAFAVGVVIGHETNQGWWERTMVEHNLGTYVNHEFTFNVEIEDE